MLQDLDFCNREGGSVVMEVAWIGDHCYKGDPVMYCLSSCFGCVKGIMLKIAFCCCNVVLGPVVYG